MRVTAISSPFFVIGVETPNGRYKLFQIICKKDGSLLVPFPYYKHADAQLIEARLTSGEFGGERFPVSGLVATHRVKYTHHVDGEAHFSQDGKILTRVRKRANNLSDHSGHLFTVQLQGLHHFEKITDREIKTRHREYVTVLLPGNLDSQGLVL